MKTKKPKVKTKTKPKLDLKEIFRQEERGTPELEKLKSLDIQGIEPVYDKKGVLEYVLFKTRQGNERTVRVLRLFRVLGVSNEIREKINNVEAFQNILNDFFNTQSSMVVLYAGEPAKSLIISYGILLEGKEQDVRSLVATSKLQIETLEKQFRSVYNAIKIAPFTQQEAWVLDKFHYSQVTYVRGIPVSDESRGIRTGTTYDSPVQVGRQVSEVLLRGMTSKMDEGMAIGESFLMYVVLKPIDKEKIQKGLELLQNELGKTDSSTQSSLNDSENFSTPMMFGYGFGEMFGETEAHSTGSAEGVTQTVSENTMETITVTNTETDSESTTSTEGETTQKSKSAGTTNTDGTSINGGLPWLGGGMTEQEGSTFTEGETEGVTTSEATQNGKSTAVANGTANGLGKGTATANSLTTNISDTVGKSTQQGNQLNAVGGVTIGDGNGVGRQIKDHAQMFATEILKLNERRYQYGKRVGMLDFHMVVLSENEETKTSVEALIKQGFLDKEAPIPIRQVEPKDKEDKVQFSKYAKSLATPFIKETRQEMPEENGCTTYITPLEATAFALPQDNFYGYDSSYDPIPPSVAHAGDMGDGASIGKQWNRHMNVLSPHEYRVRLDQLKGHIGIFGGTGQGKTVFTQRFISSVFNRYKINFLLFDWTKNHRNLITLLDDTTYFRFNSFDATLFPMRVNLIVPPKGVPNYVWDPIIAELFCHSTGLGGRSYLIIIDCLNNLHKRFENTSQEPTMLDLIDQVGKELEDRTREAGGRLGFKEQETFSSMRDRFKIWTLKNRPSFEAFCKGPFTPIEELIEGQFVHLIECAHLPKDARKFVINAISAGIFQYCAQRNEKLKNPMYMIFEEAHTVLGEPTGDEPLPIDETIFEIMSREARNYGLYLGYVCQSPEKLQDIIFDNMPIRVTFQLSAETGKSRLVSAGGRDPNRWDVDLVKWLSMQPRGMCLVRMSNFDHLQEGQFVAVKVDMLPTVEMPDDFFRKLYYKKQRKA